jgi:hypothetical protein
LDDDDLDAKEKEKEKEAAKCNLKTKLLWVQWSGELRTNNWGFFLEVDGDGNAGYKGTHDDDVTW